MYLYDTYIWNRTNSSKQLMFGSYPYPKNLYSQNTTEYITLFVKEGTPPEIEKEIKEQSKITQKEWTEFTKQIWNIPIPNQKDIAWKKHPAIMPEEIPYRLIKMFSCVHDIILDPFTGSGTTLRIAKQLNRNYIGYEIEEKYKPIIEQKLETEKSIFSE